MRPFAAAFLILLGLAPSPPPAFGFTKSWCVNYYAADGGSSRATAITTDLADKVYLTGMEAGNIWVAKLNPKTPTGANCPADSSLLAWTKQLSAGIGYSIVESSGVLTVLASLAPTGQCWVAKMDSVTGNMLAGWPVTLSNCYAGSPTDPNGWRGSLKQDSAGNILLSGQPYSSGSAATQMDLFKLGSNGSAVGSGFPLNYASNTGDTPQAVAVDSGNRIYLVGETASSVALMLTNPLGNSWTWNQSLNWTGYSSGRRQFVGVDSFDNVIAGGQFFNTAGGGLWLYAWDKNGFPRFNWWYYSVYLGGGQVVHDMALGPKVCGGSLMVAGNTGWVGRFDAGSGLFLDGATDSASDHNEGIAVDSQGNVYAAGMGVLGGVYVAQWTENCALPPPPPCTNCGGPPPPSSNASPSCEAYMAPNPARPGQAPPLIVYQLTSALDTTIKIYDDLGNLVRTWTFPGGQTGALVGRNQLIWDLTNGNGQHVKMGMYHVYVSDRGHICDKKFDAGVIH